MKGVSIMGEWWKVTQISEQTEIPSETVEDV